MVFVVLSCNLEHPMCEKRVGLIPLFKFNSLACVCGLCGFTSFVIVSNANMRRQWIPFRAYIWCLVVDISNEFSDFNATMPMVKQIKMTYWFGMLPLAYAIVSLQDIRWENLNEIKNKQTNKAQIVAKRWNPFAMLATSFSFDDNNFYINYKCIILSLM